MRKLHIESLEQRVLFNASDNSSNPKHWHLEVLPEPIGPFNSAIEVTQSIQNSVPVLSSNPSAFRKLFLDFDGDFQAAWGSYRNLTTPEYNIDFTPGFSQQELNNIVEIWKRVSEDYAIFDVDVTTVDPNSLQNGVVAKVNIGGSSYDWYGAGAGGVAFVGGFYNSAPNIGYVFPANLANGTKYIAEASAHEAGHLFGLSHQSVCNGDTLVQTYNPGGNGWAPIMGLSYYEARTTWYNGKTPSCSQNQKDIEVMSNNLPLRPDDVSTLVLGGGSVNFNGIIGHNDSDNFQFVTTGGNVSFNLALAPVGPNLLADLYLSDGNTIFATGKNISVNLPAGTYTLMVVPNSVYGSNGQYTLTGTIENNPQPVEPEITLLDESNTYQVNDTVEFNGNILKSLIVLNEGTEDLVVDSIIVTGNFTLSNNLIINVIPPGQGRAFEIKTDDSTFGEKFGQVSIINNDNDESNFVLNLHNIIVQPPTPVINGFYVWDINLETRRQGRNSSVRANAIIKWDSDRNGIIDATDEVLAGANVRLVLSGPKSKTYNLTTNSNGQITTPWLNKTPNGTYTAEVIDVAYADYEWLQDLDPTFNDMDVDGDGLPDDQLVLLTSLTKKVRRK